MATTSRMLACALLALLLPVGAFAQAPSLASATLFPDRPASVEAALVDGWLDRELDRLGHRRIGDRIVLPVLSGAFGSALAALALTGEFTPSANYALGGASAVALAGL